MLGRLGCMLGWHSWQQQTSRGVGGKGAIFSACRRCGKEKTDLGDGSGPAVGMGGAG